MEIETIGRILKAMLSTAGVQLERNFAS